MLKKLLPLLTIAAVLGAAACGPPAKVTAPREPLCSARSYGKTSLGGVPYTRGDRAACATAIAPFDVAVWMEAPYNSRKIRGRQEVLLGCSALTPAVDNCDYCGIPGHSLSAMLNFNPSVYPDDARVRRAVLAVYSPDGPEKLLEAHLRGRLNVGDELQSLGSPREVVTRGRKGGWVMYDMSLFVARAIAERRTSIHFELSLPCRTPSDNGATMSLRRNEPRLIVEYY